MELVFYLYLLLLLYIMFIIYFVNVYLLYIGMYNIIRNLILANVYIVEKQIKNRMYAYLLV